MTGLILRNKPIERQNQHHQLTELNSDFNLREVYILKKTVDEGHFDCIEDARVLGIYSSFILVGIGLTL